MIDEELAFAPATELLQLLRDRAISPVEINTLYFARIERLNPQLRAFLALTRERAEAVAAEAERAIVRGDEVGPLPGLPIAIKDNIAQAGQPLQCASRMLKDYTAPRSATALTRLIAAGASCTASESAPSSASCSACPSRTPPSVRPVTVAHVELYST